MAATAEQDGAAGYREIAETLRRIANELRFDLRRADQLRALADGFDRLAERHERAAGTERPD